MKYKISINNPVFGVPITFLDKYNPNQFEIIGNEYSLNISKGRGYIKGKCLYRRIFIRRRKWLKKYLEKEQNSVQ